MHHATDSAWSKWVLNTSFLQISRTSEGEGELSAFLGPAHTQPPMPPQHSSVHETPFSSPHPHHPLHLGRVYAFL